MRKGVEMSLNLIIMVVIGLIVLLLVIFLVTDFLGEGRDSLQSCREKGGQCYSDECPLGWQGSGLFGGDCDGEEMICCFREEDLLGREDG